MAGYSGTALPDKLGVRPGHRVLLDGAPVNLDLGPLPGVTVHRRAGGTRYDVAIGFCRDRARLQDRWASWHERVTPAGRLWIAWPKKSSGVPTDLSETVVREHGLAHGRVDVKVCAIDETWSGLAFVVRVTDR
jgi:hypothetical protein